MIQYSANKLLVDTGKKVSFGYNIQKIILFENLIVVLLKIPSGTIFNENVFGVSLSGEIIWQIEKFYSDTDDSPYLNIKRCGDSLEANNWSGTRVGVNLATGKLAHRRITK